MSLYSLLCPLPGGEQDRDKSGFPPSQRKCSNPFTEKCWMVGFTGLNCALAGCETLHSSQNIKFCESKVKYRIQNTREADPVLLSTSLVPGPLILVSLMTGENVKQKLFIIIWSQQYTVHPSNINYKLHKVTLSPGEDQYRCPGRRVKTQ